MQYVYTVEHQGRNTGGTLAITKGLVGQVEGPVGKFPTTLYAKNALIRFHEPVQRCHCWSRRQNASGQTD